MGELRSCSKTSVRSGTVPIWFEDESIRQLMSMCLTHEEMEEFSRMSAPQFSWVTNLIERKILAQMHAIISGEQSATEGLEQGSQNDLGSGGNCGFLSEVSNSVIHAMNPSDPGIPLPNSRPVPDVVSCCRSKSTQQTLTRASAPGAQHAGKISFSRVDTISPEHLPRFPSN